MLQENTEKPITSPVPAEASEVKAEERYFKRFTSSQRFLHAVLLFTFLALAATGLPLRFSTAGWSAAFAKAVGGFGALLFFHKLNAVILTVIFLVHLADIGYRIVGKRDWSLLWGRNSMVPNLKDLQDLIGQMRWFFFLGPKPKFDRFTYWEKLDYWGVFWGMAIIGISGYAMWFSGFFARLVPGSWLNIALLIHGEEALLATGYIFVVHFFNEHLQPNNFPMDITIFTGSQSEEEFKERHPEEYALAVKAGNLKELRSEAPPIWAIRMSRVLGVTAVAIGVVLIVLTAAAFLKE